MSKSAMVITAYDPGPSPLTKPVSTDLKAPEGFEFIGEYRPAKNEWWFQPEKRRQLFGVTSFAVFILRPTTTPKERRAKAFDELMGANFHTTTWIDKIERIFAENPDEVAR